MIVDPSSLLSISLGAVFSLIVVVAAGATMWARLVARFDHLDAAFREFRAEYRKGTQAIDDDIGDAVEAMRTRSHTANSKLQNLELRVGRLEDRAGLPTIVHHDPTPTPVEVPTGRHRRVPRADESST